MSQAALLIDPGGTNTRAKILSAGHEVSPDNDIIAEQRTEISTKTALLDVISNLLRNYQLKNKLSLVALRFADGITGITVLVLWHKCLLLPYRHLAEFS